VVLDRITSGFWILGKQIEREVTQYLLPKALATYKAGETLNFGALNVNSQGLSLKETPKNLPWEKLGYIGEYRGYLVIKERGTLSTWKNIDVADIINLCVLLPLIKKVKYESNMSEHSQRSWSYPVLTNQDAQQSEWQEYELQ